MRTEQENRLDRDRYLAGINIFLEGFIRTENLRFREVALTFKVVENASEEEVKRSSTHQYPAMKKSLGGFDLAVDEGAFTESEIIVLLGENGTGEYEPTERIAIIDRGCACRENNVDSHVGRQSRA